MTNLVHRRCPPETQGKTVHSMTNCRSVATMMTEMKTNALSREHNISIQMNQAYANILRGHRTAGWAYVGLVAVEELACFLIQYLLDAHGTVFCMSLLHPRGLMRVSMSSRSDFFLLSRRSVRVVL